MPSSRADITPSLLEEQAFDLYCVSVGLMQQDFDVVIGGRQGVMSQLLLDILGARSSFEPRKGSRVTCGMHFRGFQVLLTDIGDSLIPQSVASISAVATARSQGDPERSIWGKGEIPAIIAA